VKVRRLFLYLLVFVIPFQKWEPFGSPYLNITFVAFFLYFISSVWNWRKNFDGSGLAKFIAPFLIWCFLLFTMSYLNYYPKATTAYSESRQILMQFFFFLLLTNELRQNPKLANKLLKIYLLSLIFISVSFFLNIGVEYKVGRLKMFGSNANALGIWYVFGLLAIAKLLIEKEMKVFFRYGYILLIPVFVIIMALTGSRSAFFLFLMAPVVYWIYLNISIGRKLVLSLLGLYIFLGTLIFLLQFPVLQTRLSEEQKGESSLGGRAYIWQSTWVLVEEKPWFGAGASGYEKHILKYLSSHHEAHNVYLLVLAYTGIVGLSVFVYLLSSFWRAASFIRKVLKTPFYITLLLLILISFISSGGLIASFTLWFFLSLISGVGSVYLNPVKQL
jgi:O-antigen ligase